MNSSVTSLFDILVSQLQLQLSQKHEEPVTASWSGESGMPSTEMLSWSWILSVDSTSRIRVVAPNETWRELCNLDGNVSDEILADEIRHLLSPAIEETAKSCFGSEVTCTEEEGSEDLPAAWTSIRLTIHWESGRELAFSVGINPDLKAVLGASEDAELGTTPPSASPDAISNPVDILMDVEMPVSISLGRTRLRLKELLQVTSGSVVELDQDLSDEVEISVNNHVIAYGEVVAVDGNYAVRIMRMAQAKNLALRGILPGRAA